MSFEKGNHEWKKRKSSGRKPKAVVARYNEILFEECGVEDWRLALRTCVAHAKAGRIKDLEFLAERILGKVPTPLEHSGPDGEPIQFIIDR